MYCLYAAAAFQLISFHEINHFIVNTLYAVGKSSLTNRNAIIISELIEWNTTTIGTLLVRSFNRTQIIRK